MRKGMSQLTTQKRKVFPLTSFPELSLDKCFVPVMIFLNGLPSNPLLTSSVRMPKGMVDRRQDRVHSKFDRAFKLNNVYRDGIYST
mmetsp:Transcript_15286/g.23155  ORF Transcript_15286/g.23155 Transcript_15286/m.23155 type:complete len:86 (+) Transcript_15286:1328-1585(+)